MGELAFMVRFRKPDSYNLERVSVQDFISSREQAHRMSTTCEQVLISPPLGSSRGYVDRALAGRIVRLAMCLYVSSLELLFGTIASFESYRRTGTNTAGA